MGRSYLRSSHTGPGMTIRTVLALLLVSVPAAAQGAEQEITRLLITPVNRSVAVGDSLRLQVQAVDARGNVVPNATIRFTAQGGRFQGTVDSSGTVRGGAPGTVPIAIVATPPSGRPHAEKIEVRILPGPAVRIALSPSVTKLLAGQRVHVDARALTALGDERDDVAAWTSSNQAVLRVSDGVLTAVAPGNATITARAGQATASITAQVIPATGVTATISPTRISARQGDVVRFSVDVR